MAKLTFTSIKKSSDFVSVSFGNKKLLSSEKVGFIIFNLPAITTCPYATEMCKASCYALKAERVYPSAREARKNNFELSKKNDFVSRMIFTIEGIAKTKYANNEKIIVRIHESGDFYNQEYLDKWLAIAHYFSLTDNRIVFMAYTKSVVYFQERNIPCNMVVRFSIWKDTKEAQKDIAKILNLPIYTAGTEIVVENLVQSGKTTKCVCSDCGACAKCWDRKEKSIHCIIH